MLQIDWYILITPFFIVLILLTLITLKLALKCQPDINPTIMKKLKLKQTQQTQKAQQSLQTQNQSVKLTQKYSTLKILSYLLKNYTFLQFCLERKSKNKLTILLSISAISILWLAVVVVFLIAQTLFEKQQEISTSIMDGQVQDFTYIRQQVKQQSISNAYKYKILYTAYSILSIGIGLFLCGLTFKNYSNLYLSTWMKNILINSCIDIFVLRFIGSFVLCLPLGFSKRVLAHVQNQILKELYIVFVEEERINAIKMKNCATNNLSPRKQSNSPTKIPKAILRLNRQNSENQALKSAMEMARKFKQQNLGDQQSVIRTLTKNQVLNQHNTNILQQNSINSLFDQLNNTKPKDHQQQQDKGFKTKRKQSDLVIVQFKRNNQPQIQPQPENQHQQQQQNGIRRRNGTFIHSNLDYQDNNNINSISNNINLLKYINNPNNQQQQQQIIDSQQQHKYRNKRNHNNHQNSLTLNLDRDRNTLNYDQLHIYQHQNERQIQQLDTNSPQRRRARKGENQFDDSQYKLKKKAKHFNSNAKRRVIKFTSGQPYLEYLPNMLTKDNKHKKSQPINSTKHDLQVFEDNRDNRDSRDKRKSLKKTKTKKQPRFAYGGDQNHYPGMLEVEDL